MKKMIKPTRENRTDYVAELKVRKAALGARRQQINQWLPILEGKLIWKSENRKMIK